MSGASRWVLVLALGAPGCAIIALVGENRDAGFEAATVDVPVIAPDVIAPPRDAPALPDSGPPAMDVPDPSDVRSTRDALAVDQPVIPGTGQDVVDAALGDDVGEDVVVRADASATADAGMVMPADVEALEDAQQGLPDVAGGAPCRRDSDCTRDPAGMFCGMMTMRCGTVR